MKILMIETRRGTEDGFTVKPYFAGLEYDVKQHLGRAFLAAGFAVQVQIEKQKTIKRKRRA